MALIVSEREKLPSLTGLPCQLQKLVASVFYPQVLPNIYTPKKLGRDSSFVDYSDPVTKASKSIDCAELSTDHNTFEGSSYSETVEHGRQISNDNFWMLNESQVLTCGEYRPLLTSNLRIRKEKRIIRDTFKKKKERNGVFSPQNRHVTPVVFEQWSIGHSVQRHNLSIMKHVDRIRSARAKGKEHLRQSSQCRTIKEALSTSLISFRSCPMPSGRLSKFAETPYRSLREPKRLNRFRMNDTS